MARLPRCFRDLLPLLAISRAPDIVAVAAGLVIALHNPQAVVPDGHVVVLTRMPGSGLRMALPMHAVGRAPDVVVELASRRLRRVVGPAAQNPDAASHDRAAA